MADFYNAGSGLVDITATSVTTEELVTDYINSSGTIDFNLSTLSNINNLIARNTIRSSNVTSCNIQALSNAHITLSNAVTSLSNAHISLSNAHISLSNSIISFSNAFISYSNAYLKISGSNLFTTSSNLCLGTSTATQQLTLTGSIQASNLHTSNLIVYRGSNILEADKKIDYQKWIKNGPVFSNADDTLAIAGITLGSIGYLIIIGSNTTDKGWADKEWFV
jgi:hypothetical protein